MAAAEPFERKLIWPGAATEWLFCKEPADSILIAELLGRLRTMLRASAQVEAGGWRIRRRSARRSPARNVAVLHVEPRSRKSG
jgi:hypothetical protein